MGLHTLGVKTRGDRLRIFKNFPTTHTCPICKTKKNTPCVLVGIRGTQHGLNIQAKPVHIDCLDLTIDENTNTNKTFIYMVIPKCKTTTKKK